MKKILFTGARSGIASKVIEKLLDDDYYIYVTVHTKSEVKAVSKKYKNFNNVSCFKLDIKSKSDRDYLKNLDIDILVLNAAVGYGGSLIEMPISEIKDNYEVNVFSNIELIQVVLPKMIEKKNGKIIIMASLAGILPIDFLGSYCSTKASIIMLAKVLRREVKYLNANILIKIIEPGIYKTGFNEVMLERNDIKSSKYFNSKDDVITFREFLMFDFLDLKNLDGIASKIKRAIKSNSKKFSYSAPLIQKIGVKLYQIFYNK